MHQMEKKISGRKYTKHEMRKKLMILQFFSSFAEKNGNTTKTQQNKTKTVFCATGVLLDPDFNYLF